MLEIGQEWLLYTSPFRLKETTAPSAAQVPTNTLAVYAKDKAGVSALYLFDDAGNEREIAPPNTVTGTGTANRLAYWTSASVIGAVGALTQGHVLFADANGLPAGEANLFWDATNDRLGIGTASPSVRLEISAASEAFTDIYRTASDANAGGVRIAKSRSGGAVQSGDNIGLVGFGGHDGTAFRLNSATVQAFAGSLWTDTNRETYLIFGTTPNASVTRTERFRIGPAGQWGIGGATFGTAGNLFQSGGASAAPSWLDHTTDFLSQYALLAGRSGGQTLIGGTAAADDLTLRATAGVGAGSEAIIFQVGNNGATEAGRFAHTGTTYGLGIGSGATAFAPIPSATLDLRNASSAQNSILLASDGGSANLAAFEWRTAAGGIGFSFAKANGTVASPTALALADFIFFLTAQGHKGGANGFSGNVATIRAQATEAFTNTANGTRWQFSTTPNGSTAEVFGFILPEDGGIALQDGITAPVTLSGYAIIYVDTADGDLKIKFGDGTIKTIVTDT